MSYVLVNDEQAALIAASEGTLEVHDGRRHLIGDLASLPAAVGIAEAKARSATDSQRRIVVDDEQAALIAASEGTVQVRDLQGRVIGNLTPWPSDEEIAEAKARLAAGRQGPTYTSAEVLEYLWSLDQQ